MMAKKKIVRKRVVKKARTTKRVTKRATKIVTLLHQIDSLTKELQACKSSVDNWEQSYLELEEQMELEKREQDKPFRWTDSQGHKWAPKEMTEQHLRNTISFVTRRLAASILSAPYLDSLSHWFEAQHYLMKEAKRRGYRV
jgi:hypothetical protein